MPKPAVSDRFDESATLEIRSASIDEENRSVEAVLSTESAVDMYDWRAGGLISEVLLSDAVELPRQLPLLDTHSRYSLSAVLGSVRNIRVENGETIGRLHFVEGDEDVDRVWNKVRQGALTDVSVGYRITEYVDIEAGSTVEVNGREFTAPANQKMRVATKWKLREASMVPIGADELAKLRNEGELEMPKPTGDQKPVESVEESRAESPVAPAPAPAPPVDEAKIRSDAISAERERVASLRQLAADDVPADVVEKAISEGWDESRATREFLEAVRGLRQPADATGPAIHSRSHDETVTERSLAAGMMIASGITEPVGQRVDAAMRGGEKIRFEITEQDADQGHALRGLSALDLCRECCMLDGKQAPRDKVELIRAAMSGTHLDRVFTTNAYAKLIMGWDETPDTTGWCQSEDVPNFMTQEDITLRQNSGLDKHPRGATANHANFSDDYETYKASRFSKQFVADEQDFINDRLMALMQIPLEMGQSARRLHQDLVYALLLSNPTLTATSGALFNATAESTSGGHANLTTAVLGSTGMKAAITSMASKRLNDVPLNIRPQYLLVGPDLEWTAKELLQGAEVRDTTASTKYPTINVLRGANLTLVVESRLDATGVVDPDTGTTQTGSATNWMLAAGRRTIKKLYLQGTSRSPQLRSFVLSQGQWGMGWDINLDAGVAAVDYRGMHKSTGAG